VSGEGNARGLKKEEVDDFATLMIPLRTRNEKRPTDTKK
jgi:hypothetical protein